MERLHITVTVSNTALFHVFHIFILNFFKPCVIEHLRQKLSIIGNYPQPKPAGTMTTASVMLSAIIIYIVLRI